jgi:hypothetical protein
MSAGTEMAAELPSEIKINAWTGDEAATAPMGPDAAENWVLENAPPRIRAFLAPPPPADPRDWSDPRIGWGLVLPFNPALDAGKQHTADDAPAAIRELVNSRKFNGNPAPVFRFKAGEKEFQFLLGQGAAIPIDMAPPGVGKGQLPRYLLIYGGPDQIPWELQYVLNGVCNAGRLSLSGAALENYVQALLNGWKDNPAAARNTLVWAVDHGSNDITRLMRASIAQKVHEKFAADSDLGPTTKFIDGSVNASATAAALVAAVSADRPGLVVTTSHGQTGPLNNIDLMRGNLGLLVDNQKKLVRPDDLLAAWAPGGAVWYAHACCSAGADSSTLFDGLVPAGSSVDRVLKGVAAAGARVSPLPEALLGASRPLRAFIGHVEPTFDWTLRQVLTGQFLTWPIQESLYDQFYQPGQTVGLAFRTLYDRLRGMYSVYDAESRKFSNGEDTKAGMLASLLLIRDVKSMVILGDPAVTLPQLH